MSFTRCSEHGYCCKGAVFATSVAGMVLLGALGGGLHYSHDHDHDHSDCPVCWLAKAPVCTPEGPPPAVTLESRPQPVAPSATLPTYQPLLTFAARAPPSGLL
jgi:hypothetical protein